MRRQKLTIVLAVLAAALVIPSSSLAEYYVPPSNSAANQYTESLPGAGGEKGGKRKDVHPGATLGAGNAERLEKEGKAGREAAEVAAETAPAQLSDSGSGQSSTENGKSSSGKQGTGKGDSTNGGNGAGDESESGGGSPSAGGGSNGTGGGTQEPQGSSGIGQVLGQATGASDGNLGLWLPLAIVLMLVGAVAYWVRTRQVHPGHRA